MDDRAIKHYKNPEKVKAHVHMVTVAYQSLHASVDTFVFTDGQSMELANVFGTIPVIYRKSSYNIPIIIWLLDTYPMNAPLCYVKPSSNMKISVSPTVDHRGKIYLPYLHEWSPVASDLQTLVQFLVMLFSEKMPVFQVSQPSVSSNLPSIPYPLHAGMYNMPTPPNTMSYPYSQPSMPPYPLGNYAMRPYPPMNMGATPPYPPYPPSVSQPTTQSIMATGTGTITEEHIRVSLLSAVEDKVRKNLQERVAQLEAELKTLENIQKELNVGKVRISELVHSLEKEQSDWEKILTTLRDKDSELDAALLNISNQGEMDVDEAVVTTAPLYKQLLTAFAEEAATEDAIYYLGEGLRRGVIDLDIFLKHVRSLSRKQFMLRALMNKCRNKAHLC